MIPIADIEVSTDGTHHTWRGQPLYPHRFAEILKYHPPGLAPVRDASGAYHINTEGQPAYPSRYLRTFGFYEDRAAVQAQQGWLHILPAGQPLYPARYDWCGNYQGGRVTVRDRDGRYFHLTPEGTPAYPERYRYAGDYCEGVACVRGEDGWCRHVDLQGRAVHAGRYLDLDVFHKGFARARDEAGWFHITRGGTEAYPQRYAAVEPFYNGQAFCETHDGRRVIVRESGEVLHQIWAPGAAAALPPGRRAILVIGNVGAGKSALAAALGRELGWPVLAIDICRHQLGDGSAAGELAAWSGLLRQIQHAPRAIIEFSGSGPFVPLLQHALRGFDGGHLVLWLDAPVELCLQRLARRIQLPPYPDLGVPLEHLARELGPRLQAELRQERFWRADVVHRIDATQDLAAVTGQALAAIHHWLTTPQETRP